MPADLYNWIGASGGSWGSASDWEDVTSGQDPATSVPGAGDPVTISGPTGSIYEAISGGGTAASVALTGLIDLIGTYTTGALGIGAVQVGTSAVTATQGSLTLSTTGTAVQASTVTVADGTLSLNGGGVTLSASDAVTVGTPGGDPTTSYSPSWSGATGTLSLAGGATATAASDVDVAYGSLTAQGAGTGLTIGGNLLLGTPAPSSTATPPYSVGETGSLSISNGASVAVSGAITETYYQSGISVSGPGSSLTAGGTLTLNATFSSQSISGGGVLRVGALSLVNTSPSMIGGYATSLSVDSTSIVEIGSAGTAAVGAITVDAGNTVTTAVTASLIGNVVDNGVIAETGGTLTIGGTLSGIGTVQIGANDSLSVNGLSGTAQAQLSANASMTLNGMAAAGDSIAFNGAGTALTIGAVGSGTYNISTGTYASYTPYNVAATLSGFATGDGIIVDDTTLTNAVYTATGANSGTLALFAGTTTVETLNLAGNYSGKTFLLAPTTGSGSAVILLAATTGGSGPVSTTTDLYNWIGSSGGSWGNAANWQDVTSGQDPATSVPGAGDPVTISGPTGSIYEAISGGGTAASVALTGLIDLIGTYTTGALGIGAVQVGTSAATATQGSLTLSTTGTAVQASTVTVADGTLALNGGSVILSASGAVTVGMPGGYPTSSYSPSWSGATGTLSLAGGATATAASNVDVAYGSLTAQGAGTGLTIGGNLLLGTPAPSSTATPPYSVGETGSLSISNGASVAVSGAIMETYYQSGISVSGPGSSLTAGGTLTLNATFSSQSISGGGVLRVGALSLVNTSPSMIGGYATSLSVDSTSIVEIGSAGTAAVGTITVDAGNTVTTAVTASLIGNVVDNGVIAETGGTLTIGGTLSGIGTVQIGANDSLSVNGLSGTAQAQLSANASMTLNGMAAAGDSIAFNGAGTALTIGAVGSGTYNISTGTYAFYTPYTVSATLAGFATGDGIIVDDTTLTNAVYTATGANSGTLALFAGTTTVETLNLAGNYSGRTFLLAPTTGSGSAVILLAATTGGSGPVSTTTDLYNWIGSSGDSWGSASNWQDVTTGQDPATAVPGADDPVTISGPTGSIYEVINGGGAAASVALTGLIDLIGTYTTGALGIGAVQVGTSAVTATQGSLTLSTTGASVQASTVTVADGTLALNGGSVILSASGAVTVGMPGGYPTSSYSPSWSGATGTLSLAGGATATAASDVDVAYGSLTAQGAGTGLTIGGNLLLGTPAPSSTATPPYSVGETGSLSISNGASVAVSGAITETYYQSGISVSGPGSSLTAGGTLTLNATFSSQSISGGGVLRVGALSLVNTSPSMIGGYATSLSVDSTSIVEIGSAGTAAVGAITVDAGNTVTTAVTASLIGNVVDNGVIAETGGTLTIGGTLSGIGTVQIGANDSLSVNGLSGTAQAQLSANASMTLNGMAAAGDSIAFNGAGTALTIGAVGSGTYNISTGTYASYTPYNVAATLSGFATGDGIIVDDTTLTNAVYTYAGSSTGTLALYAGTTVIENLALAGNYSGRTFLLAPTTGSGSAVSLLAQLVGTLPASEAVLQGISTTFSGFSVSDPNPGATSITVTLADTIGQLSASNSGGGSVTGSGSETLTISGTVAQVDADLATLAYLANTTGTDAITVNSVDSLGSTGLAATVPVTVLPIAPPTITLPTSSVIVQQNVADTIMPVSIAYPDGAVPGEQVSATLSDSTGQLSVNAATSGGGGTVNGSGTSTLTITGTLSEVDADLATLSYLSGTPGADTVRVSANGTHGGSATPESLTVLTNAPPVTMVPTSLTAMAGSDTPISGVSLSDADAASVGETITVDLSDSVGKLSASTATPGGGGTITGAGSSHLAITGSISQVDADLATLGYLAAGPGSDTIAVNTSDGRGGSDSRTIPVNIVAVTVVVGSRTLVADTYLPFPVVEGQAITGPVAVVADSNPADPVTDFTATIDWGDGTSPQAGVISEIILPGGGMVGYLGVPAGWSAFLVSPSLPHTYADEGDFGDFFSASTFKATITFTAPSLPPVTMTPTDTFWPEEGDTLVANPYTFPATANTPFSGTVATFSDPTYLDNVASDFTATIDWGDGTVTDGTVGGGSGSDFVVSGSHTYATAGTDPVTVTLSDDSPGTATATADSTADVSGPPTAIGDGCPHFTMFDGLDFDFQGAGEFVAAKSTVPGNTFQVQMRIEPEGSVDSAVSIITQIAVQVGNDRVTFAANRSQVGWVDGAPVSISPSSPVFTLPGGTVSEISQNEYRVALNTGEIVTIDPFGDGMGLSITLPPSDGPGSIQGFFGPDEGQASDFQLPDGTVLQQPLTQDELYQEFANAWRVTDSTSLFDYGPGQTTATFTNTQYPREILTLSDFSPDLIAAAAAVVAAAGITDPTLAADAEFDYITMGDPSFISEDATVAGLAPTSIATSTPAVITQQVVPPPSIGVMAAEPQIVEANGATTPVTFDVELTKATTVDTVVDYTVIPGVGAATGKTYFDASDFGGILPFGTVTIAAGSTSAAVSIDVPNSVLGSATDRWLMISVASSDGNLVYDPTAQTDIVNNTPEPGTPAQPAIELLSSSSPLPAEIQPSLTQVANGYTVDLGQIIRGAAINPLQFAIVNTASVPADDLSGSLRAGAGNGFFVYGTTLPATISAGSAYQQLEVLPDVTDIGANSQTITLVSGDVNATGYSASLPDLTLTLEDSVIAPAQAMVNTGTIVFPNIRIGTGESQAFSVTNTAPTGAAPLDVALAAEGGAIANGSITLLAAGATDSTDLSAGLDTSSAGMNSGTVTVNFFSDLGNGVSIPALPSQYIDVSGTVYNEASADVTLPQLILHVGDPDTATLTVSNIAPADGYSENLIASLTNASGQISVGSTGPTGEIVAGATDSSSLSIDFSTAQAGTVTGRVTLAAISDGGLGPSSIDGLGQIALAPQTIDLTVTIDNYATAQIVELSGAPALTQVGTTYTLNLGKVDLGSAPVAVELGIENAASSVADLLEGSFITKGDTAIALTGFSNGFSGLAAQQTLSDLGITLDTNQAGMFVQQVTLTPTGYNASGYMGTLAPEILTVTGDVVPCFLAGTLIATERGETLVETLIAGDMVVTLSGAKRKIVWVGTGRVLATRGRRNAATPVTVLKGALADNVPHHDLRVTKGHALYLDGVLIPVEYLVNHRSIMWDDRAHGVTIYHVELETHDVLVANGAPAESYRDDGNRWLFQNANTGWDLPPKPACAPVLTGGPLVDAMWRRLLDRSGPRPNFPLTQDPDLHVSVDGHRLDVASQIGEARLFQLPGQPETVRIISRAAAPAELGLARDPRSLGVALRRIVLRQGTRFKVIEARDARLAEGFHVFESSGGFRWTDGEAVLPAELFAGFTGPLELLLIVGCTASYVDDQSMNRAA